MQVPLVMTIIGRDHPGLVEAVSRLVADHGGNWLESRMTRLGGEFAGILRITVPSETQQALVKALEGLHKADLTVLVRANEDVPDITSGRLVSMEIVGHDRPGIVHEISAALAHQGVNVEELETECASAPMSGEMLFRAVARLRLPESCLVSDLRRELEEIAGEMMVDISLADLASS